MKNIIFFSTTDTENLIEAISKTFEVQVVSNDPIKDLNEFDLSHGKTCIIDENFSEQGGLEFASKLHDTFSDIVIVFCVTGAINNELVKNVVSKAKAYRIISLLWPTENIISVIQDAFTFGQEIKKNIFLLREEQDKNKKLISSQLSLENEEFLKIESLMYADQIVQYAKSSIENYNQILSAIGSGKKSDKLLGSIREKIHKLVPVDAISLCFRSKRISGKEKLNISLNFTTYELNSEKLIELSKEYYERIYIKLKPDSRNKVKIDMGSDTFLNSFCESVNNNIVSSSLIIPLIHQHKYMGNLTLFRFQTPFFKKRERLIVEHFSEAGNIIARGFRNFEYFAKTKKEWESTFDAISDPVAVIDTKYNLLRVNKAFVNSSKFTINSIVGEKCFEVFTGSKHPCLGCPMKRSLGERKVRTLDELKVSDRAVYNVWSYPLEKPDKEINSAVLYYRNITREKYLTQQLMEADKMAEIGILAGSVAHEINNPLGGILAFSQILLRELKNEFFENEQFYQDIKEIESAALRGKKIVESLLNFSRMSKAEDLSYMRVDDIICTAISLIEYNARLHNIKIIATLKDDSPPIYGNYNQLLQVFLSIISTCINSILTIDDPSRRILKISTAIDTKENNIKIHFIDNGVKIPQEKIIKIFNPNVILHETSEIHENSTLNKRAGIGLSLAYGIIQEHKGNIRFETNSKDENMYIITIPIPKAPESNVSPFRISIQGKN